MKAILHKFIVDQWSNDLPFLDVSWNSDHRPILYIYSHAVSIELKPFPAKKGANVGMVYKRWNKI